MDTLTQTQTPIATNTLCPGLVTCHQYLGAIGSNGDLRFSVAGITVDGDLNRYAFNNRESMYIHKFKADNSTDGIWQYHSTNSVSSMAGFTSIDAEGQHVVGISNTGELCIYDQAGGKSYQGAMVEIANDVEVRSNLIYTVSDNGVVVYDFTGAVTRQWNSTTTPAVKGGIAIAVDWSNNMFVLSKAYDSFNNKTTYTIYRYDASNGNLLGSWDVTSLNPGKRMAVSKNCALYLTSTTDCDAVEWLPPRDMAGQFLVRRLRCCV